jgi:toxin ParE1/3/4
MTWEVFYAELAEQDLDGIYEYIAYTLLEPVTAAKQTNRIMDAVDSLESMPLRYRQYDKEPWQSRGLRVMSLDNYLVFYTPIEAKKKVAIIRIMNGGRDVDTH